MPDSLIVKFDSHAHLSSDELYDKADELIQRAIAANVEKIINISTCAKTLERGLILSEKYPDVIFNTAASTPHDVEDDGENFFPIVEEAAMAGKLVAIGETGLDYYYEHSKRDVQITYLESYFELAKEAGLNVVIHCRGDEAFTDLFAIAEKQSNPSRCLLHCFTGTAEQAKKGIELGWKISMSGILTFKRSDELRDVLREIPLKDLLIETDAPYLAPQSRRGQTNEPSYVGEVAQTIADVKQIPIEDVCAQTVKNTLEFFNIPSKLDQ